VNAAKLQGGFDAKLPHSLHCQDCRLMNRELDVPQDSGLTRRQLLTASAAAMAVPLAINPASAQAGYPTRPVRVIVPYPPAGGADTVSRILFQKLGEMWGQQFVIDNRGGAGGTIGEAVAAKTDPDGYTILYDATAFSVNSSLYPKLSFDYVKDFQPVFLASLVANILVVNLSVPAKTVADVIALAKSAPDGLNFASSGNGTVQHLCLEMFRHMTAIKINHIPYRGGGPALNDLIGGQVKFFFSNGAASIGHVQGGAVKAIAHTGRSRLAALPDLPAMSETVPGFAAYEWNGVFVPTGTPAEIVQRLNTGLNATLRQPDIIARLRSLNVEFHENTSEEFRAFVAAETEKWGRVVREANIKLG
jgi:tripartite-type tricarboxylate transporter receptor subunit TctC